MDNWEIDDSVLEAHMRDLEAQGVLKFLPPTASEGYPTASSTSTAASTSTEPSTLFIRENVENKIATGSAEVDGILGGGISSKELTEICGLPGVGKTQFSMQLAVNVQIPTDHGGVGGHAIYIDTEGSFVPERVSQMTGALIDDFKKKSPGSTMASWTVADILKHTYLIRILDATEQLAVVNNLPALLSQHKEVKLVIFDSIASHFRQGFDDMFQRTKLLSNMARKLMAIAKNYGIAIVFVNHVTHTKTSRGWKTIPTLGDTWTRGITNRLMLYWSNGQRNAQLVKPPSPQTVFATYTITEKGVQDL